MSKIREEALLSFNNMKRFSMGKFPDLSFYGFNIIRDPSTEYESARLESLELVQRNARLLAVDYDRFFERMNTARKIQGQMLLERLARTHKGKEVDLETLNSAMTSLRNSLTESLEWEPRLPFEHVYLSFYNKKQHLDRLKQNLKQEPDKEYEFIDGFLLSRTAVFEANMTFEGRAFNYGIRPIIDQGVVVLNDKDALSFEDIDILCAINSVFDAIDGAGLITISKASTEYRLKMPKFKKRFCHIPPEYHLVNILESTVQTKQEEDKNDGESVATYQSDVREHDATWILRGDLPMSRRTERWLHKDPRRKIVLTVDDIDEQIRAIFFRRGITLRENEWISVLVTRVKAHKRGKGRYIPSLYVADDVLESEHV